MRIFFYHHQIISHEELGQVREHKSQGETRGHETSPKTMESQAIKQRQISSYITKLNIIYDKVKCLQVSVCRTLGVQGIVNQMQGAESAE